MKELSIEEKVKAYNKAIEKAKGWYTDAQIDFKKSLETLFPELKESEDDMIRKSLIILLQHFCKGYRVPGLNFSVSYKDMLTWLENQEEQKTANKVEPKFKVGDWIISKYMHLIMQISNNCNGFYETIEIDGTKRIDNYDFIERNFKLWTIKDAKDGDVLAVEAIENYPYPFVAIYKEHCLDFFNSYCFIGFNGKFYESETGHSMDKIHPATKEQCNLLFAKMKEFGYEWDAEKKELKKIEQKSAWSEEDEKRIANILSVLSVQVCWDGATGKKMNPYQKEIDWLKSLKDRVQPQYKWSKEDGNVSEDLNIAAREYSYIKGAENIDEYAQYDFEKYNAFKAGAKWQSEQM